MSAIKNILGGHQSGFQAQGPDPKQLKTAYNQTQAGIKQQQEFVNALNAQNGLANQANVYNQLQGVVAGTGPNPAQAMLNQATGQNVANQAALMASQRGASANTGLIARQAAQQGANLQQQAAGQGATMQAQQSLNALGQAGQLANQQVGQQQTGIQNLNQYSLGQQSNLLGAQAAANQVNAGVAAQNAASQGQMIGNLMGAVGTGVGFLAGGPAGAAAGGSLGSSVGNSNSSMTPNTGGQMMSTGQMNSYKFADGGEIKTSVKGPRSSYGKMMAGGGKVEDHGKVPALVSPGEVYLKPKDVSQVKEGKKSPLDGEKIPGKAKVPGAKNSYANDTVPKTLEEGGIVLPRSVTQSKDPGKAAADFVAAVLAKNKLKRK